MSGSSKVMIEEVKEDASEGPLSLHALNDVRFETVAKPENRELLTKWNLMQNIEIKRYRYDQHVDPMKDAKRILMDTFNSNEFRQTAKPPVGYKTWADFGTVVDVGIEPLSCTVTSMDFFDRISEAGITTHTGYIKKCMEEEEDGVSCPDELRKALVMRSSDHWDLFSAADRKQAIFYLFRHFACNPGQYEDNIEPYLNLTKTLYKDLLSVRKNKNTDKLEVVSVVARVANATTDKKGQLFKASSSCNTCLLALDPLKQQITYYYCPVVRLW